MILSLEVLEIPFFFLNGQEEKKYDICISEHAYLKKSMTHVHITSVTSEYFWSVSGGHVNEFGHN